MAEEVTIDEAAHCPKCNEIGTIAKKEVKRHYIDREWWDVYVYICTNDGCVWYNTGWLVSSNERGVVYQRNQGTRGQDKTFVGLSNEQLSYGQRMIEDLVQRDLRDDNTS